VGRGRASDASPAVGGKAGGGSSGIGVREYVLGNVCLGLSRVSGRIRVGHGFGPEFGVANVVADGEEAGNGRRSSLANRSKRRCVVTEDVLWRGEPCLVGGIDGRGVVDASNCVAVVPVRMNAEHPTRFVDERSPARASDGVNGVLEVLSDEGVISAVSRQLAGGPAVVELASPRRRLGRDSEPAVFGERVDDHDREVGWGVVEPRAVRKFVVVGVGE